MAGFKELINEAAGFFIGSGPVQPAVENLQSIYQKAPRLINSFLHLEVVFHFYISPFFLPLIMLYAILQDIILQKVDPLAELL